MTLTKDDINEFCEDSMCSYKNKYIKLSRLKEEINNIKNDIIENNDIKLSVIKGIEVCSIIDKHFGEVLKDDSDKR